MISFQSEGTSRGESAPTCMDYLHPTTLLVVVLFVILLIGVSPGIGSVSASTDGNSPPVFTVKQPGKSVNVTPLSNGESIEEYYDFYDWESHTSPDITAPDTAITFFWDGPKGLSLVVITDDPDDGSGGVMDMNFSGLPSAGEWVVANDPPEEDDPPADFDSRVDRKPTWGWSDKRDDGGAFRGGLRTVRVIEIDPAFNESASRWDSNCCQDPVKHWEFLSGDLESPTRHRLDMDEPITLINRGEWPMFGLTPQRTSVRGEAGGGTGTEIWNFTTGDIVHSSPAVANGTLYIGSWDNNVYALDPETGAKEWAFTTGGDVGGSPAVWNGTVYVGSQDGAVYALDADTGTKIWKYSTGDLVDSDPAIRNGTVYVGSHDDNLYALDAATGTKKWNFTTSANVDSAPLVWNGTAYFGSRDHNVYAVDASSGTKRWAFDTGGGVIAEPALWNATVYIGSASHRVFAIDAVNGTKKWAFTADKQVSSTPTLANGTVYVGSHDTNVYALDADNGTKRWTFDTEDHVAGSAAVANGTVYIGSKDERIYALDASTGDSKWTFLTDGRVTSSPAIVDGTLYIGGTGDHRVYALDAGTLPPVGPPQNLTADAGPHIRNITLDWDPPAETGSAPLDHYNIYRGTSTGNLALIANTTATEYTDDGLTCHQTYHYEVTAVNEDGLESEPTPTKDVPPYTPLHLLCRKNTQHPDEPFYWGPRDGEMPLGDTQGDPDTPPTNITQIEEREQAQDETGYWYALPPVNVTCCQTIQYDQNDLTPHNPHEFEINPADVIRRVLPVGPLGELAASGVESVLSFADLQALFEGLRAKGQPHTDADFDNQAVVPAYVNGTASFALGCNEDAGETGPGNAFTLDAGGNYVLNRSTNTVDLALDTLFLQGQHGVCGPSFEKEFEPIPETPIPYVGEVGLEAEARLELNGDINAMVGGRLQPTTQEPEVKAGGIGAGAHGTASLDITGGVDDKIEAFGTGGFSTDIPAKGEAFIPVNESASDEAIKSPYTDTVYRNLEDWVVTLKLGPFKALQTKPLEVGFQLWDHVEFTIEALDLGDLSWSGTSIIFGEATVSSPTASDIHIGNGDSSATSTAEALSTSTRSLSDGAADLAGATKADLDSAADVAEWTRAHDISKPLPDPSDILTDSTSSASDSGTAKTVPPNATQLIIVVTGEPNSTHNVTIRRPTGHYDTENITATNLNTSETVAIVNETFGAGTWTFTIPNVTLNEDGNATLTVDTTTVQQSVKGLTRTSGTSFNASKRDVNRTLDTNGDGEADLPAGETPSDPRMVTDVEPRVGVTEADQGSAYLGEDVPLRASVREVPTGDVPEEDNGTRGQVTFRINGTVVGTANVTSTGNVSVTAAVPTDASLGKHLVLATYSGTASTARAAAGTTSLLVRDRPLVVNITDPAPAEVADGSSKLTVRFGPESIQKDDLTAAEVRIDDGPWRDANQLSTWTFGLGVDVCEESFDDGFHNLTARLTDSDGETDSAQVPFVVDCQGVPNMTVTNPERPVVVTSDGTVPVRWNASEPVAVRANLTRVNTTPADPVTWEPVEELEPVLSPTFQQNGTLEAGPLGPGTYSMNLSVIDTARNHVPGIRENASQGLERGPYAVVVPPVTLSADDWLSQTQTGSIGGPHTTHIADASTSPDRRSLEPLLSR